MAITFNLRTRVTPSYKINGYPVNAFAPVWIAASGTPPFTVSDSEITQNHRVLYCYMNDTVLSRVTSDLTITTSDGSLTVNGSASGNLVMSLYLVAFDTKSDS